MATAVETAATVDDDWSAVDPAPPELPERVDDDRRERRASGMALTALIVVTAVVATRFHRTGHTVGDDFALYLRQAKSLFEGNVGQVISDNRLLWENSSLVTPPIYPWGWPLLLSPFVRFFGLDYERLKLLEVACLCVWLVLFHGIVRRRAGRLVAFAVTAVFASCTVYLAHTDQLITELPHMLAVAVVIWSLDRVTAGGSIVAASTRRLVILGLLGVAAYNVRREGIVVIPMIAVAQLVDLAPVWKRVHHTGRSVREAIAALPWKAVLTPHLTFAAGVIVFQLLLPSTLLPDNGNDRTWIGFRLLGLGDHEQTKSYPRELTQQLGLGAHPLLGKGLLAGAALGAVLACVHRPRRNLPLVTVTVATMLIIGTHPRWVGRYYLQVTPFVALFVLMIVYAGYHLLAGRRKVVSRRAGLVVAVAVALPALWVTTVHAWIVPSRVDRVATLNDNGPQRGPTHPDILPVYDAVLAHTAPDDVIVYYRARTMTLYTDRRSVQTQSLAVAERLGDFFMHNRVSDYSQPKAANMQRDALLARGWRVVWEDDIWTLWQLPEPDATVATRTNTAFDELVDTTGD